MNKKFFGFLGARVFAASSAFIFTPAAYGTDGLDTGLRYDVNGNLICINNGYLFVPTNADGTAGAPTVSPLKTKVTSPFLLMSIRVKPLTISPLLKTSLR